MEKLKIGDLVEYPRVGISNRILCVVVKVKGKTGQYIVQSIVTGEHYVAIERWLVPTQERLKEV